MPKGRVGIALREGGYGKIALEGQKSTAFEGLSAVCASSMALKKPFELIGME
jgi:hypothetical protein